LRAIALASAALFLLAAHAAAQTLTDPTGGSAAEPPAQADVLGRDTPQGLVSGLISALGAGDYERAARYFETEGVTTPGGWTVSGAALAERFQEVLDRAGTVTTPAELSADATGHLDDGFAEDIERFGTLNVPGESATALLAARVERDSKPVWLVSAKTLREVSGAAEAAGGAAAGRSLIDRFPRGPVIWGVPMSHWAAILLAALAAFVIAWLLTAPRRLVVRALKARFSDTQLTHFIEAAAGPVRLILAAMIFGLLLRSTGVSIVARYHATFVAQIIGLFAFAWLLWRVSDAAGVLILGQMSRRGRLTAYSAVSFLNRAFKAFLILILLAILLSAFGVNVTTALAAFGLGGLAIALGAQKLFENLIGSLTVIADRPVRIGDFCRFGDALGTVEDIGIRSTRIRTLDRTVLTVPNGEFSSLHIENFSQRDRFWFSHTLNLRYETSTDQIRYLLQELRAMLYAHPKIDPDPARVRFVRLGAHSLDLELYAYVNAEDFNDFLEVQEDLLLRCMEIVEQSGAGFAFPSQTLYLSRDGGLDEGKRDEAENVVRRWRDKGELQLPRFSPDEISRLRGRIDYPPRGAAVAGKDRR
jgi:MscS family membrane protein